MQPTLPQNTGGFSLLRSSPLQRRISLAFGLFSAAAVSGTLIFVLVNHAVLLGGGVRFVENLVSIAVFAFLALLLTYQRPGNLISWLLAAFALIRMTTFLRYPVLLTFAEGAEPTLGLLIAHNLWSWLGGMAFAIMGFVIIIFPDGKLPSQRWRAVPWLLVLQLLLTLINVLIMSVGIAQGLARAAAGGSRALIVPMAESGPLSGALQVGPVPGSGIIFSVQGLVIFLLVLLATWSLGMRFRGGNPVQRQQIKWVLFALLVWGFGVVLLTISQELPISVLALSFIAVPISFTLAILRYRLYDIDLIINRTLVYGVLSAALLAIYYGSVIVLESLTRGLTGDRSPLATVLATLLIAAIFQPLRRRVQTLIDRAFFRSKYDADQTLNSFSLVIRDEVSTARLTAALIDAVSETIRPQRISVMIESMGSARDPDREDSDEK